MLCRRKTSRALLAILLVSITHSVCFAARLPHYAKRRNNLFPSASKMSLVFDDTPLDVGTVETIRDFVFEVPRRFLRLKTSYEELLRDKAWDLKGQKIRDGIKVQLFEEYELIWQQLSWALKHLASPIHVSVPASFLTNYFSRDRSLLKQSDIDVNLEQKTFNEVEGAYLGILDYLARKLLPLDITITEKQINVWDGTFIRYRDSEQVIHLRLIRDPHILLPIFYNSGFPRSTLEKSGQLAAKFTKDFLLLHYLEGGALETALSRLQLTGKSQKSYFYDWLVSAVSEAKTQQDFELLLHTTYLAADRGVSVWKKKNPDKNVSSAKTALITDLNLRSGFTPEIFFGESYNIAQTEFLKSVLSVSDIFGKYNIQDMRDFFDRRPKKFRNLDAQNLYPSQILDRVGQYLREEFFGHNEHGISTAVRKVPSLKDILSVHDSKTLEEFNRKYDLVFIVATGKDCVNNSTWVWSQQDE